MGMISLQLLHAHGEPAMGAAAGLREETQKKGYGGYTYPDNG